MSDKIRVKPRDMHEIAKYYKEAISSLNILENVEPTLVVVSIEELETGASGRCVSSINTLYVANNLRKATKKKTIEHELTHWQDTQKFKEKYGYDDDYSLIEYMKKIGKKELDANGIDQYNVSEISNYARLTYALSRYDETYVEYRLKKRGVL